MTELVEVVTHVGLIDGRIIESFDCFEGTSAKAKLPNFEVQGINMLAHKPT